VEAIEFSGPEKTYRSLEEMSGWLSDLIPLLIYGLVTVATYESTFIAV
jgi:hypothetical protein